MFATMSAAVECSALDSKRNFLLENSYHLSRKRAISLIVKAVRLAHSWRRKRLEGEVHLKRTCSARMSGCFSADVDDDSNRFPASPREAAEGCAGTPALVSV
ncbi:unnamed protein product [Cercospora beticola]|nr:unnamed protein product [Cercospora beticola]